MCYPDLAMIYDCIVVGAGIIGASTAWQLARRVPGTRILVVEKEPEPARHQTGRNSGVLHAGVYYAPGSLKARFCREGLRATLAFCRERDIAHEQCGKLLVATDARELKRMEALLERIRANGIRAERLSRAELLAREPALSGVGALFVPDTAIVDFAGVARAMLAELAEAGGELATGVEVVGLAERADAVTVETTAGDFRARQLVCCAGLQADRLVARLGCAPAFRILPFRGDYYRLPAGRAGLIRHLVYPIPDPELPFLGVHLTRMVDGSITVGPNAALALAREGYGRFAFSPRDTAEMLAWPGFWRMIRRHLGAAASELATSWSRRRYLAAVRKYCPELEQEDLLPHPSGVRAQAVSRDGTLVQDFLFIETRRTLHVGNAPSPAATSAIPIGRHVVDRLLARWQ